MTKDSKLLEKAAHIAVIAHDGQFRKNADIPYITHPFIIALKLAAYDFTDTVLAAAIVHDVLEDSDYGERALQEALGDEVVDIVKVLSEDKSLQWEERKQKYVAAVRESPAETKAVSTADKIHNLESMLRMHAEHGDELWANFSRGKESQLWFAMEMLSMLQDTWQHPLVEEYEGLVGELRALV